MSEQFQSLTGLVESPRRKRLVRVLLVDAADRLKDILSQTASRTEPAEVIHVTSLAMARQRLAEGPIDLAVIDCNLPDGSGVGFADELGRSRRKLKTVLLAQDPSADLAIQAMRAGAADLITRGEAGEVDHATLVRSVRGALSTHRRERAQNLRVRRLRRLCKKLNEARLDVSQQVDAVCEDLVAAYKELADQVCQPTEAPTEEPTFQDILDEELDLEQMLRKTLQYLVEQAGPTNAAVFLPASMDEYTLGGYVNYDVPKEAADMVLQHLADVFAPKVAARTDVVRVQDGQAMREWIGDDAIYFADADVLSFACYANGEPLAVVSLFRDGANTFSEDFVNTCETLAPQIGKALSKIIRVHHRHMPDGLFGDDVYGEADQSGPSDDWWRNGDDSPF